MWRDHDRWGQIMVMGRIAALLHKLHKSKRAPLLAGKALKQHIIFIAALLHMFLENIHPTRGCP
jgi:hypothetical protein